MLYRYNSIGAYGQSKLANILHANELARRFKVRIVLLLDHVASYRYIFFGATLYLELFQLRYVY